MTQPKRTASRLLSALLGLIMLLSLLPTVTLAAERVPEELKAMEISSGVKDEVNFRDLVWNPSFREIHDKPVRFDGERRWVRWNETANKWESYTEGTFKEGKYKYFVEAIIRGQYYDQYQFASQVDVTVDGEKWTTTGSAIDPGRRVSRIMMISPVYTVTNDRELVNRVALTSNVEDRLVEGETLFRLDIDVQSASTTSGGDVPYLETTLGEDFWEIRYPGQTEWTRAWNPKVDDRPLVQGGAYYRYVFHVELRGKFVFVDTDKLRVTLDGTTCTPIGDVLDNGRYGRVIYAYSREYYAPKKSELKPITSIDLKTSIPNILQANNPIEKPSIRETNNKMVFRADSDKDGWQYSENRAYPYGEIRYNWEKPKTQYFVKGGMYRYGAVLTVKDWEHWKLGAASKLTVTVDGERIPSENIKRLDNYRLFVYSKEHQAQGRTPIEEVNVTSNMASIVKPGGMVQTPTITFNDGDQDLYIDGSIGFGWLKWEDSDWYTYEKGEFEPGKYCYYTNVHVGNWDEYAFSDNVTVNWDGKPCDRPTGRAPSQIFVSSPVYIVPETVEVVTATSSDIDRIPKLGGAMTNPTFTVQTGQPARFREDYPYCAWFKKVDGQWKECGLHVDMDKIFTEGTYRYCVYLFIGGKGHTEDRAGYVFSSDSKVIVNGTMWETWSYKVTDTSSWLRVFSPEYTISSTPANVTLGSAKAVSGGIQVTWQAASGAAKYKVYRKDAVNTKWTVIATVTGTSYTDKSGTAGTKYSYTVRGVAADGKTLSPGFDRTGVSATMPTASTTPANVTLGSAKAVSGGIQVTWQAASGAAKYKVYRKDASNTVWRVIATVTGTSYTDKSGTAGTKYSYTVRGVGSDGKTLSPGFDRTGVSATMPTASTTPAKVVLVSAKADSAGILVTWQKANGAHAYRVYRKDAVNSKWTVVAKNVRDTEWKDITAVKGTKYTYTVRAVADDGVTLGGYDSAGKSAMVTASPTTPANVTLSAATAGRNGIVVTWSYAADARTYRVYRKAPGDTKWVAVANVNGKSWTDKNVTSGVKYSYTVRGVNANGKLSPGYNKTGVSAVAK